MTVSASTTPHDDRWPALYTLCAGVLMIILDATIVNVALPSIQDDLGFSQSSLAWVVNAYLIPFGGLLLLAGRFGDLLGQRRMFLLGLAVFTAASAVCAVSVNQGMLIAARFVQGAGGAAASAVVLGMIVMMFPEPREQAKAIGVYSFVASAGGSIGLIAGGVLTEAISWHWIFLINVPVGIATAVFTRRLVEDKRGIGLAAGADLPGAVFCTVGLMAGVYAILGVSEMGVGSPRVLGFGAASLVLLAAFVVRQARVENPLMPLRLFRSRDLAGANIVMILSVPGMFAVFFLGALYLQRVLGFNPLEVGLAFLPFTLVMGTISLRFTERLTTRFGASRVLVPGFAVIGAGLLLFARAPADGTYLADVLAPLLFLGFGAGVAFPSLMGLAMSGATAEDSGLASGVINSTTQVGGAIGLAVLATLSASRTNALRATDTAAAALNGGYHLAYLVAASLVAGAMIASFALLRSPHGATASDEGTAAETGYAHA
jgi:EmrB/QacA subfamily drug resistance transporter